MRHITLITTGGTIEKTYDEFSGRLENQRSIVHRMLRRLRLEDTTISVMELLSKDSLEFTDSDRALILEAVKTAGGSRSLPTQTTGIVILHGTDTLQVTGELVHAAYAAPRVPIVLVGAWRPYEMTRSDALQNLTEALFSTGVLPPGVYAVAHGRALRFPGVVKDRARGTFVTSA
jgi:L-asparaginase